MRRCRICDGPIRKFLDLGKTPLPEEFRTKNQLYEPVITYPLNLVYCTKCDHVQLGFIIPPDIIYKKNYFYDYSITKTGFKHWQKLAQTIFKDYNLNQDDLVLDIGSNTGTLLSVFKSLRTKVLGVDPATKLVRMARKSGIPTINSYFTSQVARRIVQKVGLAKVVTCNNTFDHVDDLAEFMQGIKILLKPSGVFIIEVPYLLSMLNNLSHIPYHQQIDYFHLKPLLPFLGKFGFEVFDAEKIPLHGGSIRIFIGFKGHHIKSKRLKRLLDEERISNKSLLRFAKKILRHRGHLIDVLKQLKKDGKKIAAIGASAKGITLFNYCGLDLHTIDFITEKSSLKIGRFTASGIPIVSDHELLRKKPDYALLLAWNFQNEILDNLKEYQKLGGKFIIPVPKIELK